MHNTNYILNSTLFIYMNIMMNYTKLSSYMKFIWFCIIIKMINLIKNSCSIVIIVKAILKMSIMIFLVIILFIIVNIISNH